MMPILSLLVALEVVVMTTHGVTSNDKGIATTISFQWPVYRTTTYVYRDVMPSQYTQLQQAVI